MEENIYSTEESINLSDIINIFISRWYWFVLSVFVALALAFLYLARTPFVYTRYAEILIKEDKKGASALSASDFSDLGLFSSNTNVLNEVKTIESPQLMTEVVRRLRLNENYSVRAGLRRVTLYNKQPVEVYFKGEPATTFSMSIELIDKDNFIITDFCSPKTETRDKIENLSFEGKIGVGIKTPVGVIALSRSKNYKDDFIGTPFKYTHGDVNDYADIYAKNLTVELSEKKSSIVILSLNDESTKRAEDVLNTLITVYNENWVKDKNRISVSTSKFISERLRVIESELGNVDANISSFKSTTLVPDLEAASRMYMQQSADNKKEIMGISTQLATAQFLRNELASKDISQPLPTNSGIDNQAIEMRVGEYNNAVLDRNRLLASSSESNPLVQDLSTKLHSLKQTILQSVDNYISSLRQQMGGAQRMDAMATGKLASGPNQAKYLLSVERQQKVKEALYLFLLEKREENELSQAFTAYNTRVITEPRGSKIPTSPKKMMILLGAFFVGLLIPALILWQRENMNTKVRGRKDLEGVAIPLIGEIPLYVKPKTLAEKVKSVLSRKPKKSRRSKSMNELVISEGSRDVINEAFRVLRSNLDFMSDSKDNRNVFVMTSFNPGSGKSFITMNLAVCMAIKNKKVLVIDGDLRHASSSAYVGSPKKGLSDYLGGKIERLSDIIVKKEGGYSLDVLPVGTVPPNPTELLENGKLGDIVMNLRTQYDYIFIDCPPIDIVADTQIIEKYSDRTIFIIRAGLLERSMLGELGVFYNNKRFKNLSLILNGTLSSAGRYSYKYGYKYGYYGSSSYYASENM